MHRQVCVLLCTAVMFIPPFLTALSSELLNSSGEEYHIEFDPYEFKATSLNLSLLATVQKKGRSTAMLRNKKTNRLKSYKEGDFIDIIPGVEALIVGIQNCALLLERDGVFESLFCKVKALSPATVTYRGYTLLSRFRIADEMFENPPVFKTTYDREIKSLSRKHNVDPYLVKAIIKAESNFNPDAVSPKKAMGIMQITPGTAYDYGLENPYDPLENIDTGVRVLRNLIDYFYGNKKLVLAAYNAGRGAVIRHGFKVPPYDETRTFVERVLNYYTYVEFDEE